MASGDCGREVGVRAPLAALIVAAVGTASAVAQIQNAPPWLPNPSLPALALQHAPVVVCFQEGTDPAYARRIAAYLDQRNRMLFGGGLDYHVGTRWSGGQGTPRALTWSFIPDGVMIPGGEGEPDSPSELFAQMDSGFSTQGGRATWIARIQAIFDRWSQLSGVTFTRVRSGNNDWDDGAPWGSTAVAGVRGDMRISMHPIDGPSNVLAYCFFPSSGDMVIDSGDINNFKISTNQHRFLRNCLGHELGHGLGLDHTCPTNETKLMEPFISTMFDGPRQDDIRAAQRLYGDPFESNDTAGTAKALGALLSGSPLSIGTIPNPPTGTNDPNAALCSIDGSGKVDYYSFSVGAPTTLGATVTPIGSVYDNSAQVSGVCQSGNNENALAIADLVLTVYGTNGSTVLATANAHGAGLAEMVSGLSLPAAGTYYVKVSAANSPVESQLYKLDLSASCATTPVFTMQPPSLLVQNGQNFVLTATATNATSYQWKKDNIPLGEGGRFTGTTTPTLTVTSAHQSDAGNYVLVAVSGCAQTSSQPALVTVQCYANCDGSTTAPILSINDYTCFINKIAMGDTTANCDGSTSVPILNILDLLCFQGRFNAGCQ